MFIKEFQTRLCGRMNILHATVDAIKEEEEAGDKEEKISLTNISYSFFSVCFYLAQQKSAFGFKNHRACWVNFSNSLFFSPFFHASIKVFLFAVEKREGRKGKRLVGYVEWKIRSRILLICHFSSCRQHLAKELFFCYLKKGHSIS